MLWLLVAVMLFHLSIMLTIIPYEITWGGKLKSTEEMYVFETVSMIINLFLFTILLIKGRFLKQLLSIKAINVILWVFFALFGLNTIGNALAETNFEKFFAILTLSSSYLLWIILRKGEKSI